MIIVTGGTGFIGSNLIHRLNAEGHTDIAVVEDFDNAPAIQNVHGARVTDYYDWRDFPAALKRGELRGEVEAIYHQGACTDTMETDGRYMMACNFTFSKELLRYAVDHEIPFVYASSAAVYGAGQNFREEPSVEAPLNVYGFSKWMLDEYARSLYAEANSTIVGLRYFNVYGPGEAHKGRMASIMYQLYHQVKETGRAKLFDGTHGYGSGEQCRDWIHVDDVIGINTFFGELDVEKQGVFNVGSGRASTFNRVAEVVIDSLGYGEVEYIPFPDSLEGKYQSYTCADLTRLRAAGYDRDLTSVSEGVASYVSYMESSQPAHQLSIPV